MVGDVALRWRESIMLGRDSYLVPTLCRIPAPRSMAYSGSRDGIPANVVRERILAPAERHPQGVALLLIAVAYKGRRYGGAPGAGTFGVTRYGHMIERR